MERIRFKVLSSRTWRILERVKYRFRSKRVETIREAIELDLSWNSNVHGDRVIMFNCRSIWIDKYGNYYHCGELIESKVPDHLGIRLTNFE